MKNEQKLREFNDIHRQLSELYHEIAERVNLEHLDLICEALNCELDELMVWVPNKQPKVVHMKNGTLISPIGR